MIKIISSPPPKSFLKTKKYFLFWIASFLSNIGTWMQQVAQPWVMLTVSHSSFLVGLDSFAMNAPAWALTLWGGFIGAIFAYFNASKFKEKSPSLFGLTLGAVVIGTALNQSLLILMCLMIFAGVLLTLGTNTANSNLQLKATNQVRGIYASLFQLAFRGGLSLGALVTGILITEWGIVRDLLFNGILASLIQLVMLANKTKSQKI